MVKKITILALMAALASAIPLNNNLDERTWPIPSLSGGVSKHGFLNATQGWSTGVASAIEACAIGVNSGCVDSASKAALASWIAGAGAAFFDFAIRHEIKTWCTSSSEVVLGIWAQSAMEAALIAESSVSAAGGMLAYFNGLIESSFTQGHCACSAMGAG